jgi:hypothetical protein
MKLLFFGAEPLLLHRGGSRARGGLRAAAHSQARTVFIKKCILLTKNAYYNMYTSITHKYVDKAIEV